MILRVATVRRACRKRKTKTIIQSVLNGSTEESSISIDKHREGKLEFSIKYTPAQDEVGTIIDIFITVTDITERAKLERKHRQLEADLVALIENYL